MRTYLVTIGKMHPSANLPADYSEHEIQAQSKTDAKTQARKRWHSHWSIVAKVETMNEAAKRRAAFAAEAAKRDQARNECLNLLAKCRDAGISTAGLQTKLLKAGPHSALANKLTAQLTTKLASN